MSTKTYSQTSRDRLAANFFIVIPVLAVLGVIRYFQRPKPSNDIGRDPALPL